MTEREPGRVRSGWPGAASLPTPARLQGSPGRRAGDALSQLRVLALLCRASLDAGLFSARPEHVLAAGEGRRRAALALSVSMASRQVMPTAQIRDSSV